MHIDTLIQEFSDKATLILSDNDKKELKFLMACYAMDASMDKSVAEEANSIIEKYLNPIFDINEENIIIGSN